MRMDLMTGAVSVSRYTRLVAELHKCKAAGVTRGAAAAAIRREYRTTVSAKRAAEIRADAEGALHEVYGA